MLGCIPKFGKRQKYKFVGKAETKFKSQVDLGLSMVLRLIVLSMYFFTALVMMITFISDTNDNESNSVIYAFWSSIPLIGICILIVCFHIHLEDLYSLYETLDKITEDINAQPKSFVTTTEIFIALLIEMTVYFRVIIAIYLAFLGKQINCFRFISYNLLYYILKIIICCEYYHTKIITSNLEIRCFKILSTKKFTHNY